MRKRISIKLAQYCVVVALLLGLAMSTVQILRDFANEGTELTLIVDNILEMARPPAVVAARLLDGDQAAQIVDGLMTYDFVIEARLVSDFGEVLASRKASATQLDSPGLTRYIAGDTTRHAVSLVDTVRGNAVYGEMIILVDPSLALAGFFERSWFIVIAGILRNLLLALVLFGIFHWLLTKPLINLISSFRNVDPRNPGGQRLSTGGPHVDDELGLLAEVGNEYFLASERHLKNKEETEAALRESEKRFRSTFEQAAVGIAHIGTDGSWLRVNKRFCDILRYDEEELLVLRFQDITDPKDLEDATYHLRRQLKGEEKTYTAEKQYIRKDGSLVWVNITAALVQESDTETGYLVTVIEDISPRKKTEQKQQELEASLRQAQKMEAVGQLTGGIAHDFNNVLSVIMGNLELLRSEFKDNDNANKHLIPALSAAERGAALTHRLLAFARKQTLNVQDIDVGRLLDGMDDMLRRSLDETIEIKVDIADGLWLCEVDPGQLEQALLNLAVNARDAMPEGGPLNIETSNTRIDKNAAARLIDVEPGDYVSMAISDSGIGMTPEIQEQIFDPFFTTKEVGKGTGMGLSMVFGFAKQSGGYMTVYSEVGLGTTLRLYLPRSHAASAAPTVSVTSEAPRGKPGETILAVEDDPDLRDLVESMLKKLGYKVLTAENGTEALEKLSAAPQIDLLLSDVVLPGGMSGPDIARKAVQNRAELKVLYMSGYTKNALMHLGRLDPGVELLGKPFTVNDLGAKLRTVLNG